MPYEKFTSEHLTLPTVPTVTVSVSGRFNFNSALTRDLAAAKVRHLVILYDKASHGVALRAVPEGEDLDAHRVSFAAKDAQSEMAAGLFLKHLGWSATKSVRLHAKWSEVDRMIEFVLPVKWLTAKNLNVVHGKKKA